MRPVTCKYANVSIPCYRRGAPLPSEWTSAPLRQDHVRRMGQRSDARDTARSSATRETLDRLDPAEPSCAADIPSPRQPICWQT